MQYVRVCTGGWLYEKDASSAVCALCKERCCTTCSDASSRLTEECCNITICGAGKAKHITKPAQLRKEYGVDRDACIWKWKRLTPFPVCGHPRCSVCASGGGGCGRCRVGAAADVEASLIEADLARVDAMAKDEAGTSASLRAALLSWSVGAGRAALEKANAKRIRAGPPPPAAAAAAAAGASSSSAAAASNDDDAAASSKKRKLEGK
jgi:hypothetical protein